MTEKPLLLLDIDGVLNFFGPLTSQYHRETQISRYRIRLDRRHPLWLVDLEQEFEIVWATMWQDMASGVFAPFFGWGEDTPHIDFDKHAEPGARSVGKLKLPGIIDKVGDRPALWIDDDAGEREVQKWAKERNRNIPTMLIVPDSEIGLTKQDAVTAFQFAKSVAEQSQLLTSG
jgi:hypothetical protein